MTMISNYNLESGHACTENGWPKRQGGKILNRNFNKRIIISYHIIRRRSGGGGERQMI